jgi:hypothetical protein
MSESNGNGKLEFDSPLPREKQVRIGSEDYVLLEGTAAVVKDHRNAMGNAAELNDEGKVKRIKGFAEIRIKLVVECIRKVENGERKRVSQAVVESWPSRIVEACYDACEELTGIGEHAPKTEADLKAEAEALKNSQAAAASS